MDVVGWVRVYMYGAIISGLIFLGGSYCRLHCNSVGCRKVLWEIYGSIKVGSLGFIFVIAITQSGEIGLSTANCMRKCSCAYKGLLEFIIDADV